MAKEDAERGATFKGFEMHCGGKQVVVRSAEGKPCAVCIHEVIREEWFLGRGRIECCDVFAGADSGSVVVREILDGCFVNGDVADGPSESFCEISCRLL